MSRILFVAPSSYPINGPEAMVNAKHIKLLCDAGYDVDLVCRGIRKQTNYYPDKENSCFFYRVCSINIVATKTKWDIATLLRHFLVWVKTGYVYKAADWAYDAIQVCEKLIKQNHYDYILTKDYPSEIVGVFLSKKRNIKWIPTWNDPYMWKKYPFPYGKGVNYHENIIRSKLIRDIGKYATINIFPSDRLRDYMLTYMRGMSIDKCVIMPHIVVDKDIVERENVFNSQDNVLRIIHAGSIGKERNPAKCLYALKRFVNENPTKKIELTFLGVVEHLQDFMLKQIDESWNIKEYVKYIPPVSYKESLNIVSTYDVCLVLEAPCEVGIFLPSKIADYLQNNKPIFAISPKVGVMADLHKKGVVDFIADVNDENSIYESLCQIFQAYEENGFNQIKSIDDFKIPALILKHKKDILV